MTAEKKLSWNDLFMSGSVVDLTTWRWPARASITAVDLGIEDTAEVAAALHLGCHRLIPGAAFKDINAAAGAIKRAIDYHSLPFGLLWGTRYVPDSSMEKLADKLKTLREQFYAAVEAFVESYEAEKTKQLPIIQKALQDAAKTPEAAATAYERLTAEYPPAEVVRSRFGISWRVYAIQGPRKAGLSAALEEEGVEVKNAIAEMAKSLREEVTTKLQDVLSLVQKGGKLQKKSVDAALQVLEHVEAVNVLGDQVLATQVKQLRKTLMGINLDERVTDETVKGLSDIKAELETSVADAVAAAERKLTRQGRRAIG